MRVERYYTRRNSNCLSDFFFKAKLTQTGLSCAIELFAIEKLLEYNKTWFCSYCVKLIGELNESTQRNCIICNIKIKKKPALIIIIIYSLVIYL